MRNKFICALSMIGIVLFYIFYRAYFSYFLLIFACCVLALSFMMGLWSARGLRIDFTNAVEAVVRGESIALEVRISKRNRLPLAKAKLKVCFINYLSGEKQYQTTYHSLSGRIQNIPILFTSDHCGMCLCSLEQFIVTDLLGVISIRVKPLHSMSVASMPRMIDFIYELDTHVDQLETDYYHKNAVRKHPFGDYDFREYVPGDPLRSIHWKLSAKVDKLIVRELIDNPISTVYVLFDFYGKIDPMDQTLEYLQAFSGILLEKQCSFEINWYSSEGNIASHHVEHMQDFHHFLSMLMMVKLPDMGYPIQNAFIRQIEDRRNHYFYTNSDGITDLTQQQLMEVYHTCP